MKKLTYFLAIMAFVTTFVACEKSELLDTVKPNNENENVRKDELKILSFNSEDDFYNTVRIIRENENLTTKTRSVAQNFKSFF